MGLPLGSLLLNTLPVFLLSLLIALGLWFAEGIMIKAFSIFGRFITALGTLGLMAAGTERITGHILIPGLGDLSDAFVVVGEIALVLAGALPLLEVIKRILGRPMGALGRLLGINESAVAGLLATLANSIPTFAILPQMDRRGKLLNTAFAVSGAFAFGDHLAFAAGFEPTTVGPMIAGKLTAGILAVILAFGIGRKEEEDATE